MQLIDRYIYTYKQTYTYTLRAPTNESEIDRYTHTNIHIYTNFNAS